MTNSIDKPKSRNADQAQLQRSAGSGGIAGGEEERPGQSPHDARLPDSSKDHQKDAKDRQQSGTAYENVDSPAAEKGSDDEATNSSSDPAAVKQ